MKEDAKIDVILSAKTSRPASAVYVISAALALWSLLLTGRWWLNWAQESIGHEIAAVILWPVTWFILLFLTLQIILLLASLTAKIFRQPNAVCGPLACWYTVLIFTLLATIHLLGKTELDFELGAAWFIGLAIAMAWRILWRLKAGNGGLKTS